MAVSEAIPQSNQLHHSEFDAPYSESILVQAPIREEYLQDERNKGKHAKQSPLEDNYAIFQQEQAFLRSRIDALSSKEISEITTEDYTAITNYQQQLENMHTIDSVLGGDDVINAKNIHEEYQDDEIFKERYDTVRSRYNTALTYMSDEPAVHTEAMQSNKKSEELFIPLQPTTSALENVQQSLDPLQDKEVKIIDIPQEVITKNMLASRVRNKLEEPELPATKEQPKVETEAKKPSRIRRFGRMIVEKLSSAKEALKSKTNLRRGIAVAALSATTVVGLGTQTAHEGIRNTPVSEAGPAAEAMEYGPFAGESNTEVVETDELRIEDGQGFESVLNDIGVEKADWASTMSTVGPKLAEQGKTYKMIDGNWGLTGKSLSKSDINLLKNA